MNVTRKLSLKKESLTELTSRELTGVSGGETKHCLTLPVNLCLSIRVCEMSEELTCVIPTYPHSCAC